MVILKHSIEKGLEKSELIKKNEDYRERLEVLIEKRTAELKMALDGIIQVMLSSLEFKDPYTASHQRRVAELSKLIAIDIGVDKHSLESIYRSGIIHDIGKISIPAEILTKPTKLSEIEFELIKSHAQIGYDILKDIKFPWKLADIIHQHHEKLDGSGYPNGIIGDQIIPETKIITVADIVEAMGSQRPYRAAINIEIVYEEMEKNKGKYYDPLVVEKCLHILKSGKFKL
jgi:putative nucleotidyltransferase with HDIG domain